MRIFRLYYCIIISCSSPRLSPCVASGYLVMSGGRDNQTRQQNQLFSSFWICLKICGSCTASQFRMTVDQLNRILVGHYVCPVTHQRPGFVFLEPLKTPISMERRFKNVPWPWPQINPICTLGQSQTDACLGSSGWWPVIMRLIAPSLSQLIFGLGENCWVWLRIIQLSRLQRLLQGWLSACQVKERIFIFRHKKLIPGRARSRVAAACVWCDQAVRHIPGNQISFLLSQLLPGPANQSIRSLTITRGVTRLVTESRLETAE